MTKFAGPEFGWLQIGSWIIIIGTWIGIVYFAWRFFMENPMAKTGKVKRLDKAMVAVLKSFPARSP